MFPVVLTILGVVLASWMIIKKVYAPWALLMTGLLLLVVTHILFNAPVISGKGTTNSVVFDFVQVVTNLMKSRAAGLGLNIMVVGGFAAYMDKIGATRALVNICAKPLHYINAPYLLLACAYMIGQVLNIFIPSATGLGMLLMVTFYPLLVSVGVSRLSAAAVIATASALDLGPASGNTILGSELSNVHVMEFFFNGQAIVAFITVPLCACVHIFYQRYMDNRDRKKGCFAGVDLQANVRNKVEEKHPLVYAILPLLPVVLLFVFSKFFITTVKVELITALLSCMLIAFAVDWLCTRNFKESAERTKSFYQGMGKVFTSTVVLIICAEVFAAGLKSTGGIQHILDTVGAMQNTGGITMLFTMVGIMAVAALVTGSANAAFFAFSHFLPQCAKSVGWETIALAVPVQLSSGIARSMSPISGVLMAVSGLANVSPFDLARRTIPPMLVGLVSCVLVSVLTL